MNRTHAILSDDPPVIAVAGRLADIVVKIVAPRDPDQPIQDESTKPAAATEALATVDRVHRRTVLAAAAAVSVLAVVVTLVVATNEAGESEPDTTPPPSTASRNPPSTAPGPEPRAVPAVLPPDMRSLNARDLQIKGNGNDRQLRFAAWLANDGPGPLLVEPRPRGSCPAGQRSAAQLVHVDTAEDGVFQRGRDPARHPRPSGCMVDHPTHDHWHFDAMARYALTTVDGTEVLAEHDKVSFCLRDNTPVPGTVPRQRKEFFGECGPRTPQGISPGWVDVYDVDTPGQGLRLPTGTADGAYCLHLEADPHDQLLETDETDNATALAVRITGTNVRRADTNVCADTAA
ncbi:MAG: lysyl oxidase family protein [Nocardioidaceae bacterium]